jgi:hypothetical protein
VGAVLRGRIWGGASGRSRGDAAGEGAGPAARVGAEAAPPGKGARAARREKELGRRPGKDQRRRRRGRSTGSPPGKELGGALGEEEQGRLGRRRRLEEDKVVWSRGKDVFPLFCLISVIFE